MTQLSQNFSLGEMTTTSTGKDNRPTPQHLANLTNTALAMQAVRVALGNMAIKVNSAYRSAAVNRAVGGSATSAHCLGYAVDFVCPAFGTPMDICKALVSAGIKFDQLIMEKGRWVHISFDPSMRGQVLSWHGGAYLKGLVDK